MLEEHLIMRILFEREFVFCVVRLIKVNDNAILSWSYQ